MTSEVHVYRFFGAPRDVIELDAQATLEEQKQRGGHHVRRAWFQHGSKDGQNNQSLLVVLVDTDPNPINNDPNQNLNQINSNPTQNPNNIPECALIDEEKFGRLINALSNPDGQLNTEQYNLLQDLVLADDNAELCYLERDLSELQQQRREDLERNTLNTGKINNLAAVMSFLSFEGNVPNAQAIDRSTYPKEYSPASSFLSKGTAPMQRVDLHATDEQTGALMQWLTNNGIEFAHLEAVTPTSSLNLPNKAGAFSFRTTNNSVNPLRIEGAAVDKLRAALKGLFLQKPAMDFRHARSFDNHQPSLIAS
jgi:hypothetical protein